MYEGGKGEPARLPPVPPKRKGAKNTDNIKLLREDLRILWNYVIEVQDLIAEIVALVDNPDEPSVPALLRAGQKPEQILADMVAAAKGDPIRATGITKASE